jgi:threonine aldolase
VLSKTSWVAAVEPVETNILIFSLAPHCNDQALIEIKAKNISISSMGPGNLE